MPDVKGILLALALLAPAARAAPPVFQCPDGSPPPCARPGAGAPAPGANSVAVLQFGNTTRDSAYDYLSDGLATEIATTMARVPRLEVRSPGAVRSALRGGETDQRVIARRLNVRYLVEGDFQRGGDRIRISVRLVASPSGTQRWGESYTRPAADLLTVQEEIARNVATAIAGTLLPQERSVLAARPTRNPAAYDRVLRGNFHLARRTPGGVSRAIEEYTAALRLDSTYSLASARVSLAYALYLDWGWDYPGVPVDSQRVRGMRAADRALTLDSLSADGWMARGYHLAFRFPRTLEGVLEALRRSTMLDSTNAEAWHQYGSWLNCAGLFEEALVALRRALTLEPARPITHLQTAQVLDVLRRFPEARRSYDSAIVADPQFYGAYSFRTWLRLRDGDITGARADAEAALRFSPAGEEYYGLAPLAGVAAHSGDSVTARRLMALAVGPFAGRSPGPFITQMLALGLLAAGEPQQALEWLERTDPVGAVLWNALVFPNMAALHAEPRYQRLLEATRPPMAPR